MRIAAIRECVTLGETPPLGDTTWLLDLVERQEAAARPVGGERMITPEDRQRIEATTDTTDALWADIAQWLWDDEWRPSARAAVQALIDYREARYAEVVRALERFRDAPHVLKLDSNGWGLQHPPQCRPALTECEYHRLASELTDPATVPYLIGQGPSYGQHEVTIADGKLQIVRAWKGNDPALALLDALAALKAGASDEVRDDH